MRFVARVGLPDGRVAEEIFEAPDERKARERLEGRGYHVFDLRSSGLRLGLPSGEGLLRRRRKVSDQEFLLFNQELASLLKAGLPLLQALEMLIERQRNQHFRQILADVFERVKSGAELSEAFAEHGDDFPSLYPSSLKAGERSGELEKVVRRFVRYLKILLDTRKKVVSALVYPAALVTLSAVMLVVMMVYVIPKFRVFFTALDVELPWITRALLALSDFLQSYGIWLAIGLAVGWFLLRRWRRTALGQEWFDALKLKIPLIGGILHRFSLSEFSRSLGTLVAGGMPLVPSLEVSIGAMGNARMRQQLSPIVPAVREGKALHEALDDTGTFTDLGIDMVKVGEATGALDEMLLNISDFFDDEIETKLERTMSLLEPIMLIFMGLSVAALLLSMYLPLFLMLGQLQG